MKTHKEYLIEFNEHLKKTIQPGKHLLNMVKFNIEQKTKPGEKFINLDGKPMPNTIILNGASNEQDISWAMMIDNDKNMNIYSMKNDVLTMFTISSKDFNLLKNI
ncbi:MAG: hypothetical protein WC679_01030 [Bacteroidales bacterium]|jgi:hypothetical protein